MLRKRAFLTVALTMAMTAVLPLAMAFAATPHVMTINKTGGPAVKVGAILKAPLKAKTKATFFSPGTTTGIKCSTAHVTDKVIVNPLRPGTVREKLTSQTFSKCTTNIPGTTSVKSVTVVGLPYRTTVSDAKGFPVTVTKPNGSIKTKVVVKSLLGSLTCVYSKSKLTGSASNTGNKITFKNQVFKKSAGSSACPAKGSFSATFAPLRDVSVSSHPLVFIN